MILYLADQLDVPLRERNELLLAARPPARTGSKPGASPAAG